MADENPRAPFGWPRRQSPADGLIRLQIRVPIRLGRGPDPRVVDALTPAMCWGRKVVFHHAAEDLLGAVQAWRRRPVRVH